MKRVTNRMNCSCSVGIPLLDEGFSTEATLHQLRFPMSCSVLDLVGDAGIAYHLCVCRPVSLIAKYRFL